MEETQNSSGNNRSGKKTLTIILIVIIILLVFAIVVISTPLKEVFAGKTAPEIELVLLRGPELDEESGKYLFEVEAMVTGKPAPQVTFNRYDNPEEVGEKKVTLLLLSGEEFTLMAVAENSEGKASTELVLDTGTPGEPETSGEPEAPADNGNDEEPEPAPAAENKPPVISEIIVSHDILSTGTTYTVTANASDPDGDELIYQWSVTGGTATNLNVNPISWKTPNTPGDPIISVVVRDGRGGEVVLSKQVPVGYVNLSPITAQSGRIIKDHKVDSGMCIFVGDDNTNRIVRGYIFFDISELEGVAIKTAELRLAEPIVHGSPAFMHGTLGTTGLRINVAQWGDRGSTPLALENYNLPGQTQAGYTNYNITHTSVAGEAHKVVGMLQNAIDSGYDRFLIRLLFSNETSNGNNQWDGVEYKVNTISLNLTF